MFTWICPQCGAEVPPAYNECPHCQPVAAAPPPPPSQQPAVLPPPVMPPPIAPAAVPRHVAMPPRPTAPTPTAPPPPVQQAPVAYAPPPPQAPAWPQQPAAPVAPQPAYYPPPEKQGLPAWLVTIGVFVALIGAGYAFYTLVLNKHGASASTQVEGEAPAPAAAPTRGAKALSKHLEAAGVRIVEEGRRPTIRLLLVNHSNAELSQLKGTIMLTGGDKELAAIPFNVASLGAYESTDISAPLQTKLRAYELPDWQFIKAQVQLTSSGTE